MTLVQKRQLKKQLHRLKDQQRLQGELFVELVDEIQILLMDLSEEQEKKLPSMERFTRAVNSIASKIPKIL